MNRTITSEVVVAYSLCPQKAFLLLCTEEKGTLHEYEQILHQQKRATQSQALKAILPTKLDGRFSTLDALTSAGDVLVNATLVTEGFEVVCGLLTKFEGDPFFHAQTQVSISYYRRAFPKCEDDP